jgi:cation transporter-like permease
MTGGDRSQRPKWNSKDWSEFATMAAISLGVLLVVSVIAFWIHRAWQASPAKTLIGAGYLVASLLLGFVVKLKREGRL